MKAICLGDPKDVIFEDKTSHVGREPWPFFDVTGSQILFGKEPVVSSGVYIHTHTHQFGKEKWLELPEVKSDKPTIIGDYVFIGVNAQIMHTCKNIGDYSVIAAGSIVTKDIPSHEIWGGNPAVKIGEVERG